MTGSFNGTACFTAPGRAIKQHVNALASFDEKCKGRESTLAFSNSDPQVLVHRIVLCTTQYVEPAWKYLSLASKFWLQNSPMIDTSMHVPPSRASGSENAINVESRESLRLSKRFFVSSATTWHSSAKGGTAKQLRHVLEVGANKKT